MGILSNRRFRKDQAKISASGMENIQRQAQIQRKQTQVRGSAKAAAREIIASTGRQVITETLPILYKVVAADEPAGDSSSSTTPPGTRRVYLRQVDASDGTVSGPVITAIAAE